MKVKVVVKLKDGLVDEEFTTEAITIADDLLHIGPDCRFSFRLARIKELTISIVES